MRLSSRPPAGRENRSSLNVLIIFLPIAKRVLLEEAVSSFFTFEKFADVLQLGNVVGRIATMLLQQFEVVEELATRVLLVELTKSEIDRLPRRRIYVHVTGNSENRGSANPRRIVKILPAKYSHPALQQFTASKPQHVQKPEIAEPNP